MMRKWSVLFLVMLFAPVAAYAQNTGKLAGRVLDASNGEPLPGATVFIEGSQLGAAADANGNYFIIGVPVGTYSIRASFIGYESTVYSGVDINSGRTRDLDFSLQEDLATLDEVVVEYERPLIQKDAIGVPKVLSGDEIKNLPVRGVASVAAIQGGVIANEGSGTLNIRGGRGAEVAYYVDGVKVVGSLAVPQAAIQEQEMLIGSLPAKYGDALSGIISITTKSARSDYFGTLEGITSEVLDPYGYNLGEFSLGGPLLGDKLGFFISGNITNQLDRNPRATDALQLKDGLLSNLQANPQSLRWTNDETGEVRYTPLPGDLADGVSRQDVRNALASQIDTNAFSMANIPFDSAEILPESSYETDPVKRNYSSESYTFNGNLTFSPITSVRMKVGGRLNHNEFDSYSTNGSLYNYQTNGQNERDTWSMNGAWTHYLSNNTFYQVSAEFSDYEGVSYNPAFSSDVSDVLFYGDFDHSSNAIWKNYKNYDAATETYVNRYGDGSGPQGAGIYSIYAQPGSPNTGYSKFDNERFRVSATATTQIGLHQIEFGGEYEQNQNRAYSVGGNANWARFYDDGDVESGGGVTNWNQMTYNTLSSDVNYYGYDYLGLNEVDDQNPSTFATDNKVAPYEPIYYAGYIQDKLEYRDLVINFGVRVDVFDNNTFVLKDQWSLFPIIRANTVSGRPSNIGTDHAVYFDAGGSVVGYRSLDGIFFDENGQIENGAIIDQRGKVTRDGDFGASVFEDYEPEITVMPRVGVSFPVTDRALFFAHYDKTSQRPTERSFSPLEDFFQASQANRGVNNTNLRPQLTTEYELGFRQRLGSRAAFTMSGFYKQISNLAQFEEISYGFPRGYTSSSNNDFGTVKGAQFEFDLRRTNNVSINANYTLSFAQGTGSSIGSGGLIAWVGSYYPDFISPLDFDRRHSINLNMDYRFGQGEGPMIAGSHLLQGLGFNMVANIRSGQPYTALTVPGALFRSSSRTVPLRGGVNADNLPWSSLINLRVDKSFAIGDNLDLTGFLWVQNLLDADNILSVWQFSGRADDDGWSDSQEGTDFFNNGTEPDLNRFLYGFRDQSPFNYGIPRMTRIGLRLSF